MQRRSWAAATLTFALAWTAIGVREGLSDDYGPGGNYGPTGNSGLGASRRPAMDRRFPAGTGATCLARPTRRANPSGRRRGPAGRRARAGGRRPITLSNRRRSPPPRCTARRFPCRRPIFVQAPWSLVGSAPNTCCAPTFSPASTSSSIAMARNSPRPSTSSNAGPTWNRSWRRSTTSPPTSTIAIRSRPCCRPTGM